MNCATKGASWTRESQSGVTWGDMGRPGKIGVLMLGWEFPPHITGGLGVACHGMLSGLKRIDRTDVCFAMPSLSGDEDVRLARFVAVFHSENRPCFGRHPKAGVPSLPWISDGGPASGEMDPVMAASLSTAMHPKEFEVYRSEVALTYSGRKEGTIQERFLRAYLRNVIRPAMSYADGIEGVLAQAGIVDLVHAHDWFTYIAAVRAKFITGKPLIAHVHSTELDRAENVDRTNRDLCASIYAIERFGFEKADRIVAVSDYTRDVIVKHYGIPSGKVVTVHNGLHFGEQNACGRRITEAATVVFIGRVTYQKGPMCFVETATKVLKSCPSVSFVIAGAGDQLNAVKRRVSQLGLENKFLFTGFLSASDVRKLLEKATVYVMPSVSEPFGISALEALAANVPIVISKQSGVREVVPSATAVDAWDTDGFAAAIEMLIAKPNLAAQLVQRCRREVRRLSWNNSAKRMLEVYESLAK